MQAIPISQAVGTVLAHDITRIIPGEEKGPVFKKGHVIREQDIDTFLNIGKESVFVLEMDNGQLHEDMAAKRIAHAAAGQGLTLTEPSEGRINLVARHDGLLKVDVNALNQLNAAEDVAFGTLHTNHRVTAGQPVASTRVIPLIVSETCVETAERLCEASFPLIQVKPFQSFDVGMVTTGSEVYHGRIKDKFGPVLKKKFKKLGSRITRQIFVSDNVEMTVSAIHELIREGVQMVALTGGMSVDPDDQTPASIRAAGAEIVSYGAPTFPGAMFLVGYIGGIPVVGLPGCVMYYRASIFDLIIPRLLTGEKVRREDIVNLGHGGFCATCKECSYPLCSFGKA